MLKISLKRLEIFFIKTLKKYILRLFLKKDLFSQEIYDIDYFNNKEKYNNDKDIMIREKDISSIPIKNNDINFGYSVIKNQEIQIQ